MRWANEWQVLDDDTELGPDVAAWGRVLRLRVLCRHGLRRPPSRALRRQEEQAAEGGRSAGARHHVRFAGKGVEEEHEHAHHDHHDQPAGQMAAASKHLLVSAGGHRLTRLEARASIGTGMGKGRI